MKNKVVVANKIKPSIPDASTVKFNGETIEGVERADISMGADGLIKLTLVISDFEMKTEA